MSDTDYIGKRFELDAEKYKDGNIIDLEKKQFAYWIRREEFDKNQKREEGKKSEIKDNWTGIYHMIGFYIGFQGVWFQGVTQLAAQRGCSFSIIPIILSVLVSLATIFGVHLKISKVRDLEESLHKDRLHSKVLQSFISACEREGVNFDYVTIEAAAARSCLWIGIEFGKASVVSRNQRILVLVSLTIASLLFAWLILSIMCDEYV